MKLKIGFIGFGKMGGALAKGALDARVCKPSQIAIYDQDAKAKQKARKWGVHVVPILDRMVRHSDLIFLCVKPQQIDGILASIKSVPAGKACFVSIAAGVPLSRLQKGLGVSVPVLRVMPNTPALLRAGMSAVSAGRKAKKKHIAWVHQFLESVGRVVDVAENNMDAVTAVSGSGPAYAFALAEAMVEAAVKLGLKKNLAVALVHQTLYGAGQMLSVLPESAQELRKNVTSPGGTTEAALQVLDKNAFKKIVALAIKRASQRSKELAR